MFKKLTIIFSVLILTACGVDQVESNDKNGEKLEIYTTIYPLAYFAEQIGTDYVDVSTILPAGSDPHNYEPTSKTMVDIANSDLFIFNGVQLEVFADKISTSLAEEDVVILEAAEGLEFDESLTEDDHKEHSHEGHDHHADDEEHAHHEHANEENHNHDSHDEDDHGHSHGDIDPHIWLDPPYAVQMAENIKDSLVDLMPEHQTIFENNFEDLKNRLSHLDKEFNQQISQAERKELVVTHAAYGYWEQRYGIEQIAITGISPSDEPSQKKLEEIIEIVKEKKIEYILFEQNVQPKVATVIQQEAGADILYLHNLSVLTEEEIDNKEDYFTLMKRNLEVIDQALNN